MWRFAKLAGEEKYFFNTPLKSPKHYLLTKGTLAATLEYQDEELNILPLCESISIFKRVIINRIFAHKVSSLSLLFICQNQVLSIWNRSYRFFRHKLWFPDFFGPKLILSSRKSNHNSSFNANCWSVVKNIQYQSQKNDFGRSALKRKGFSFEIVRC